MHHSKYRYICVILFSISYKDMISSLRWKSIYIDHLYIIQFSPLCFKHVPSLSSFFENNKVSFSSIKEKNQYVTFSWPTNIPIYSYVILIMFTQYTTASLSHILLVKGMLIHRNGMKGNGKYLSERYATNALIEWHLLQTCELMKMYNQNYMP